MEILHHDIPNFRFHDGTVVPSLRVAYTDRNPTAAQTALIVTFFRGRLASTCSFSEGPLHALANHRIVTIALLGNGESASPSNTPGFPTATVDYRDCVRAQHHLLVALGVTQLDVVVGFSMGGQTAYHWAALHPLPVRRLVLICASARTSRHNHQFLEGPRAALANAVDYVPMPQRTASTPPCHRGLHAFGKAYSGWLTSADWFEQACYQKLGFATFEAWDDAFTGANYKGWEADDLLAQLGMWQRGDITRVLGCAAEGESDAASRDMALATALAQLTLPVLLLPSRTDQYFRWEASAREASYLPDARLHVIPTVWGHLAGIGVINEADSVFIDQHMQAFLAEGK